MKNTIKLLLLVLLIISSCKKVNNPETKNTNSIKVETQHNTILKIVKSSNLDTKLYNNYDAKIDRVQNDSFIIKVYIENNVSDNPKEKQIVESAIAWLLLLPEKEKLFNTSVDPDNPIELKFNKQLCKEIIKSEFYKNSQESNQTLNNTNMKTNTLNFDELFIEKATVKFKPQDINNTDNPEIIEFKEKLELYLDQNPKIEDFDVENLLSLVNNETFSNSEGYIDSSWIDYFIKKYKIDMFKLNDLLDLIIEKEDYNALKILINNGYIFSSKELSNAKKKNVYINLIIKRNDVEDYYDKEYSKIKEIEALINKEYLSNHIQDPDGYTNLREGKSIKTEILEKISNGEKIQVLDNTSDWFLVKTKSGNQGFVFKTKIKAE